jgi:hypothetical protein
MQQFLNASRTPVNYTGGGSLAGHWGILSKARSKVYLEYHSVCPLVRIGTPPPPLPQASVSSPEPKGEEGTHSPAGEGVGVPTDDWRKT